MSRDWSSLVKLKKYDQIEQLINENPALIREPNNDTNKNSLLMLVLKNKKEPAIKLIECIVSKEEFELNQANDLQETNRDAIINSPLSVVQCIVKSRPEFKKPLLDSAQIELASASEGPADCADLQLRLNNLKGIVAALNDKPTSQLTSTARPQPVESKLSTSSHTLLKPPAPPRKKTPTPASPDISPLKSAAFPPKTPEVKTALSPSSEGKKPSNPHNRLFELQNARTQLEKEHLAKQAALLEKGTENRVDTLAKVASIVPGVR